MKTGSCLGRLRLLLLVLTVAALPTWSQARHHRRAASGVGHAVNAAGAFDYYLLSLSIAPSFCALSPANRSREECRTLSDGQFRQTPLTVHGLWPNRAFVSVNRQPQHCPGPELTNVPGDTQAQLQRFMPGGEGLAQHEWSRHGTCSGLSPAAYFSDLVHLARAANNTIGAVFTSASLFGHSVRIGDLLSGVASRDPALARAIVVSCRFARGGAGSDQPLIEEIRVVLSKDLAPLPVESVGLRQNSGCPNATGFLPA